MTRIGEVSVSDCGLFLEWYPVHAESDTDGAVFEVYADGGHFDVGLDVKPQSEEIERFNVSLCLTPEESEELSDQLANAVESLDEEATA